MPEITDEFAAALREIEAAVAGVYRADRGLLDAHVDAALDGLLRRYQAEARGRPAPALRLSPPAQAVFTAAQSMCEWLLERETVVNEEGVAQAPPQTLSVDELAACLKRLRRSVESWTRNGGRQGYVRRIDPLA